MRAESADAVIVGAGASGCVLAKELSQAGLRVVLLERGPKINPEDFYLHDEILTTGARSTPWSDEPFAPREFRHQGEERFKTLYPSDWGYAAQSAVVGGGMLTYGGLMWRRPPVDFRMKPECGHLPGTTLEDWPFTYDDLEPCFTQAEYEMGVSGEAGVNRFDGQRSKPYPLPPIEIQPGDKLIRTVAKRKGYHPFIIPLGILTEAYRGRNPCIQHPCCTGYVCEIGAKSTPVTALLPDALASGNCTLIPNALVEQITVDARGNPNGVEYYHEDKLVNQPARLLILAGSAIESPRLLLNSASKWHPKGLGNRGDWVGRNLMGHTSPSVYGVTEEITNEDFGPGGGIGVDDYVQNNAGFVGSR